jgi:hypothetical protein
VRAVEAGTSGQTAGLVGRSRPIAGVGNYMSDAFEKAGKEAAAFQKMCLEGFSKATEAAFKITPDSAPPEIMRQIRAGIFQMLAESWDEFLRSPQFLDGMRQCMDNAIAFRKISNEFLGRVRNDLQAPSRSDIDTVMLAVRHMEKRLLDRLDEMSGQMAQIEGRDGNVRRTVQPKSAGLKGKHARASKRQKPAQRKAGGA